MAKENILFGIIGLLLGFIISFSGANYINRSAMQTAPVSADAEPASNSTLPPDHPPIPSNGDPATSTPIPQITEAIEKARQNPQDYEAQMTAADLYYQTQKFEDAAIFYEIALKLRPNEIEPLAKLGNANFDAKKFVEAEKWYEKALQKAPKDINIRNDYGLTFYLRTPRDIERAIKEYKITLEIEPNHEMSWQNLAVAYKEKNDTGNLSKALDTLKKINPDNPLVKQLGQTDAKKEAN